MHRRRREREKAIASLGIAGLAVALYVNSLGGQFVFDDHSANPDVRSNTPLSSVFKNDFWGLPLSDAESHKSYRPLTVLSFRLNHCLHGLWTPGFHAVNVATHTLVCVLFLWSCMGFGVDLATSVSASLLFTSHPIHTEAVANIVGRSELLMAVFFLLSLISYQKTSSRNEAQSLLWIFPTVLLSGVSLLCKEQGVTVLGLCIAVELISILKTKSSSVETTSNEQKRTRCVVGVRSIVLLSATAALLFLRIAIIARGTPTFVDSDNPASFSPSLKTRALTYGYLCALNLWLLLCPSQLCHDWSMGSVPLVGSLIDARNLATLSLSLAAFSGTLLVVLRVIGRREPQECMQTEPLPYNMMNDHNKNNNNNNNNNNALTLQRVTRFPTHPKRTHSRTLKPQYDTASPRHSTILLVAVLWTVIPFLPASNLFFPVGFVVAERVLYLPSMGFCLLLALGINSLRTKSKWPIQVIAVSLLVLIFSAKTLSRNSQWYNTDTLVHAGLKTNPGNAKLHMSMGNELAKQGDRRCEKFYRNAIKLRPQYSSAWANLGLVLINTDRSAEAEEAYRTALRHKPDHINANTNMGHLCRMQGRWEEAIHHFRTALERRPHNPTLRYFVGMASEELGTSRDIEVATEEYGLAVQYNPQYWEAHHRLGRLLASDTAPPHRTIGESREKKIERLKKALHHYQMAAKLKADDSIIQHELESLQVALTSL